MRDLTLALRGLWFHRRAYAAVAAGTAAAAAVLTGALVVGDSVRGTLREVALERLGSTRLALEAGPRSFRAGLADPVSARLGVAAVPVLTLRGTAARRGGEAGDGSRLGRVRVLGVPPGFWGLGSGAGPDLAPGEVALGERLARELGAGPGDEVALRVWKPGPMPREAPLAGRGDRSTALGSFTVKAVLADRDLGRFGLEADQSAPRNAFVSLGAAQELAALPGQANLLLVGGGESGPAAEEASAALGAVWTPEDAGLRLRPFADGGPPLLESDRVFLDPEAGRAALEVPGAEGALAYLANEVEHPAAGRSTPYSFVLALAPAADGPVPADLAADEIVVNRWLADALDARPGDEVALSWFGLLASGGLEERRARFRVRSVADMDRALAARAWLPRFPGLAEADTCRDWDLGVPLDPARLADPANEAYWKQYRETPKAFVSLEAGRALWGNRFGDLTAVRFPRGTEADARAALLSAVDPAGLGLSFRPVREEARRAAARGVDLGGLFAGMSSFLVAAAVVLAGLLFGFSAEGRREEVATLRALGFPPGRVRRVFLLEAAAVAVTGAAAGGGLGLLYGRLLLGALAGGWRDAVAEAALRFRPGAGAVALGAGIGFAAALAAAALTVRGLGRSAPAVARAGARRGPGRRLPAAAALVGLPAGAVCAAGAARAEQGGAAGFFAAGALLLLGLLGLLGYLVQGGGEGRSGARRLWLRAAARRPGRGLAVSGVLASGCFVLVAVGSVTGDPAAGAAGRSGGTGGFALVAEATIPVLGPLLPSAAAPGAAAVAFRVRDGDDATCRNLNRAGTPRLLGVSPGELSARGAFAGGPEGDPWRLLGLALPDGAVPGLAGDEDTARWNLGLRPGVRDGDALEYRDERGRAVRVRLVGALPVRKSVLQGSVIVSEEAFAALYPSEEGHRLFLVDAAPGEGPPLARALAAAHERRGLDVEPALDRLRGFYAVEAAYVRIFLALGGLGLVLGSLGLAVVVARNVLERRAELGVLRAVGFSVRRLRGLVAGEHLLWAGGGVVAGSLAGAVAALPALRGGAGGYPLGTVTAVLLALLLGSALWTAAATALCVRGDLVSALRNE